MEVRAKTYKLDLAQLLRLDDKRQGGSLAEWSVRRPAVPGSSNALVTCWISPRSSRVEIVGHGVNSQLVASCQLGFLILLCCI